MIRGRDIVVLMRLLGMDDEAPTVRALDRSLGLGLAQIHRALSRLEEAQLVDRVRRPLPAQVDEFLYHSPRYLFPPKYTGETRGVATAWAALPLRERVAETGGLPPVWPHARGKKRGVGLEPIHDTVPEIALKDPDLHARLAVFDALRAGDARMRSLAREEIRRLLGTVQPE